MKRVLPLFIMIDAAGWEILSRNPFLKELAPTRKKLTSVFGYSSTCVPSILSGRWPDEHRNWCYFVYDPKNSPFRSLKPLQWLPTFLTSRRIFRRILTKLVKRGLNFRGYFDLYNIPFKYISLFDFTEKKSPLKPEGMNRGPNIFDYLEDKGIPYFVTEPLLPEEHNRDRLLEDIKSQRIQFAFQYWAGLDGLLHRVGNNSPEVGEKLKVYEEWITSLVEAGREHYDEVALYVFSDHGMANCDRLLDLRARIDQEPVQMGKDYAVIYDSTMARFWFFNQEAREIIEKALSTVPEGRIVEEAELRELRAYFEDGYFGELIFLVEEGTLVVPSHMGERPIRGMHGYHPSGVQSDASLLTNQETIPEEIHSIPHIYQLMERWSSHAQELSKGGAEENG